MSHHLWRFLLEDDVHSFQQYLANATYTSAAPRNQAGYLGGQSPKIGSPASLATSPQLQVKSRKSSGNVHASAPGRSGGVVLTRADLNARDAFGRTLLHHAASKPDFLSYEFVRALLGVPFVDLYAQDLESGWTALHRALYFGNIASAQALMQRDVQDATDYTTSAAHTHAGGLVKIKDVEGNSPFEVFGLTIAPRDLQISGDPLIGAAHEDDGSTSADMNHDQDDSERVRRLVRPSIDLQGDEVFAFGSNKNLTLGTGDEDDRQFPEQLHFVRPHHLLVRLHEDHMSERQKILSPGDMSDSVASLGSVLEIPTLIQNKPVIIQDVVMSKLHTAVLTADPIANLHICGFGSGGRLGTGDESTSFTYQCIQAGGLAQRCVSAIALGQDHTVAICSQGEVFTWGSNRYGQLGYSLPEVSSREVPTQLLPRQVYGLVKNQLFIGAAASSLHSAIYTSTSLFTFGKNAGQLGLMDADARSLETQTIPRRVAPSILSSQIKSVSAIDRATVVLLETHDVVVFTHYGFTKVSFQLAGFPNYRLTEATTTRYDSRGNFIQKISTGGTTICALSSYGEVFTIEVPRVEEATSARTSTTNPAKARNALPPPTKVWSIRKEHMSAIDAAVGQDASIILCTRSGSVWRKEKRANIKIVQVKDRSSSKPKDYKFVRVTNTTRAVAVRSNAFGAFAAVRKDSDVTREQVLVAPPSMWADLFPLLPFHRYGEVEEDENSASPQLRFWRPVTRGPCPAKIKRALITKTSAESDLLEICSSFEPLANSLYDTWITSTTTDVRIPVHSCLLKARSTVLREALTEFKETYYFAIPNIMAIEYGQDGQTQIQFQGADFLTLANLVLYIYTDELVDVAHLTSKALQSAARYRNVRGELMKIALHLELRQMERAVRLMIDPAKSLCRDMEAAVLDPDLFADADVIIELSNEAERPAHTGILCARCPFFDGLFNGHTRGMWMSSRRGQADDKSNLPRVDLKHMDPRIFDLVLRHLYADTGAELFDEVVSSDFEELAELVVQVLSAANELMIDRLSQICQNVLAKFVNPRNVCQLLNAVADCAVNEFEQAALEYICLNLESMLEQRLLEDLDPELLPELDKIVHGNQLAYMPFARSTRARDELLDKHVELADRLEQGKQRRIDSMRLRSRLVEDEQRLASYHKFRVGSYEGRSSMHNTRPEDRRRNSKGPSPRPSPLIMARDADDELPFEMDEDAAVKSPPSTSILSSPDLRPAQAEEQDLVSRSLGQTPEFRRTFLGGPDSDQLGAPSSPLQQGAATQIHAANLTADGPSSRTPWQQSNQAFRRVDLKDVMDQAAASRISGLTQPLKHAEIPSIKTSTKMSQKERKRQVQRAHTQEPEFASLPGPADVTRKEEAPASPWKAVKQSRSPFETPSPPPSKNDKSGKQASTLQGKSTMTMRQTVARTPSSARAQASQGGQSSSHANSVPSTTAAPPTIQSIRHTPTPVRTPSSLDATSSMAEILAQQQTEKTAVKEAVAKRSLQEIQQEQEFQEWWDTESRRIQEEQSSASTPRRGKGGRTRTRERTGARDGALQSSEKQAESSGSTQHTRNDGTSSSSGARRARGRGQGR